MEKLGREIAVVGLMSAEVYGMRRMMIVRCIESAVCMVAECADEWYWRN